jgi:hypothetical protein
VYLAKTKAKLRPGYIWETPKFETILSDLCFLQTRDFCAGPLPSSPLTLLLLLPSFRQVAASFTLIFHALTPALPVAILPSAFTTVTVISTLTAHWTNRLLLSASCRPALAPAPRHPRRARTTTSSSDNLILTSRSSSTPGLPSTPPDSIHSRLLPGWSDISSTFGRRLVSGHSCIRASSGSGILVLGLGLGD